MKTHTSLQVSAKTSRYVILTSSPGSLPSHRKQGTSPLPASTCLQATDHSLHVRLLGLECDLVQNNDWF